MKNIADILDEDAVYYLDYQCKTIDKSRLYQPGPDTVDRIWAESDRNIRTLETLTGADLIIDDTPRPLPSPASSLSAARWPGWRWRS